MTGGSAADDCSIARRLGGALVLCVTTSLATAVLAAQSVTPERSGMHASPEVTAFVHVNVIPMDRDRVLSDQTVIVSGDRVTAMGPAAQVPLPAGATQVEGRGKFLIPGLADMHVHLVPDTDTTSWSRFLFALLATGVTNIRDMHSGGLPDPRSLLGPKRSALMLRWRAQLARHEVLGPRLYTAGDVDEFTPADAAMSVVELKADGHDFVKVYSNGRPAEVYDSIKANAIRVGLRMVGHVPPEKGLEWVLAAPFASIEHLMGYEELAPPELHRLVGVTQRAGVWNCPTLTVLRGDGEEEMAARVVAELRNAGAGLLSGTDVIGTDEGEDPLDGRTIPGELELLVGAGLTPYEALQTSTSNVAAFLYAADSTGTVGLGKRADLVLLEANPLTDISHVRALAGVMVAGRWLSKDELDRQWDELSRVASNRGAERSSVESSDGP